MARRAAQQDRRPGLGTLLPQGIARARPLHRWVRVALLLFITVSALDAVRLVLTGPGLGFGDRDYELLLVVLEAATVAVLALRSSWTWLPLAALLPPPKLILLGSLSGRLSGSRPEARMLALR